MKANALTASAFRKDALISLATGVLSRVITFAALAVITRTYASQDYGLWLLILSLATFFLPLCTLRYEIALVLATTDRLARGIFIGLVGAILGMSAVVAIIVAVIPASALSAVTGVTGDPSHFLWIIPVTLLFAAINALLQSWLTRTKQFGWLGTSQAIQMAVTAIVTILLPLVVAPSAAAAAAGALAGFFVSIALMLWAGGAELARILKTDRGLPGVRKALHEYRVYPYYVLPYSISLLLSERILQVTLVGSYSIAILGSFLVARQIFQAPAVLLMSTVRNVLLAHGSGEESIEATRQRTRQLLALLTVLAAPALAFGTIWIEILATWALGTAWPLLAEISWWQMFAGCVLVFSGPLDRLFDLVKRQKQAVALQVLSDLSMLTVLLGSIYLQAPAATAIAAISIVYVVCQSIFLWFALRAIGISRGQAAGTYARFAAFYLPCLLLVAAADRALPDIAALLVGGVAIAAVSGFGLLLMRRQVEALAAPLGDGGEELPAADSLQALRSTQ